MQSAVWSGDAVVSSSSQEAHTGVSDAWWIMFALILLGFDGSYIIQENFVSSVDCSTL